MMLACAIAVTIRLTGIIYKMNKDAISLMTWESAQAVDMTALYKEGALGEVVDVLRQCWAWPELRDGI